MARTKPKSQAGSRTRPLTRTEKKPDWTWIRAQYRADILSTREIARQSTSKGQKVSNVAIEKRAKKEGWKRDLGKAVRSEITHRLAAAAVNGVHDPNAEAEIIVDAAATQGVEVIRSQRTDIHAARTVVTTLFGQLADATNHVAEMAHAVNELEEPKTGESAKDLEERRRRRDRLLKSIGLGPRATISRDLSQALRALVGLERQAFNLNDRDATAPDSIEERLAKIEDDDDHA